MSNKFQVTKSTENGLFRIKISNNISGEYLTILPDAGARLNEAVLAKNGKLFSLVNSLSSPDFKARDQRFNNAKLFPFAGRIKDGKYNFNGNEYTLELNYPEENNACHGLVYDKQFKFTSSIITENDIAVSLEYTPLKPESGYPFMYKIVITYLLHETNGITCITSVENTGADEMLFSDGWHHYFHINDRKVNSLTLKSEVNTAHELTNHGIPTGKTENFRMDKAELIGDKKLDNVFSMDQKDKAVTTLYSAEDDLSLNIWQQAGEGKYRFLVIYTPAGRDTIAVEPISNNTNSFNNKQNIILLQHGKKWEGRMGFFIQ
jgi:aldose 1-epimerase